MIIEWLGDVYMFNLKQSCRLYSVPRAYDALDFVIFALISFN